MQKHRKHKIYKAEINIFLCNSVSPVPVFCMPAADSASEQRLAVQYPVVAVERFQKIIVGISQRNVYLPVLRNRARAVHQNKVAVLAQFGTIPGAAQRVKDRLGAFQILLRELAFAVRAQFKQRGSGAGGGRSG